MKDTANMELRDQHRAARATARKLDRKLRNAYFLKQCATRDQRKLWCVMNTVTGRRKEHRIPEAPLDELSQVFGSVVHDPTRPPILDPPMGPMPAVCLDVFEPVTASDIAQCLKAIDPRKATGSDGVPGIVLQKCADTLSPILTSIINSSLTLGTVPSSFKHSHVCPLYKSGDQTSARNYRPVSLLPIVSRVLEHFVKEQLSSYLQRNNLYPPSQFAYRKSHSTEDALVLATNRWYRARSDRLHTGIIMIDMSKAFDRVQHPRLINELYALGISGVPLLWFCSYLSGRTQQVKVKDSMSRPVACSRGVPQGSVLGPILFVLYTRN